MSELTHEIAASQPDKYRILSNGAIYDLERKRIAGNPPGGPTTAITQSNADEYHELNRQKRLEIAYRGLERGTGKERWDIGAVDVVAALTRQAMSESSRSPEAARLVFTMADLLPDRNSAANQAPQTVNIQAFIGNDVVNRAFARRIMEAGGLVDGELASGSGADGAE